MVMVITVDGTGDPGTGLGRIIPLIDGMPPDGLMALIDFDGGTEGAAFSGPFIDKSGNGRNFSLKAGYQAPIQRSYGVDVVSPHGAVMNTGLSGTFTDLTVITALTPLIPGGESGLTINCFSGNQSGFDDGNPANSNPTSTTFPTINMIGSGATGNWALYADATSLPWGVGNRQVFTGSPGYSQPAILAVSMSGTEQLSGVTGLIRMMAYGQVEKTISSAAIASFFDGVTVRPDIVAGIWPTTSGRSSAPVLARLHSVAVYSRSMSSAVMAETLSYMNARLVDRGVL